VIGYPLGRIRYHDSPACTFELVLKAVGQLK
jgi:hypothetical protein